MTPFPRFDTFDHAMLVRILKTADPAAIHDAGIISIEVSAIHEVVVRMLEGQRRGLVKTAVVDG